MIFPQKRINIPLLSGIRYKTIDIDIQVRRQIKQRYWRTRKKMGEVEWHSASLDTAMEEEIDTTVMWPISHDGAIAIPTLIALPDHQIFDIKAGLLAHRSL
ncbi:MAG: hypothetical protein ACI9D5_001181 [Candidatus Endobugula sp.]|jgi:hypothetical protein